MKERSGITLIALIVTIVIILILAGVAISMLMPGGIISKAQEAAIQTKIEGKKEKIELEIAAVQAEKLGQATLGDLIAKRSSYI